MPVGFKILEPKIGKELKHCKPLMDGKKVPDRMLWHGPKEKPKPKLLVAAAGGSTPPPIPPSKDNINNMNFDKFEEYINKKFGNVDFIKKLNEAKPRISQDFLDRFTKKNI